VPFGLVGLEQTLPFALWLLPARACADWLDRSIGELAERHGAQPFVPHLTICSGHGPADAPERWKAVEGLSRRWRPLALKVDGLDVGADYFTFLFLRLDPPHGVDLIGEAVGALPGCHGPAVGLHLSLLYADPIPGAPGTAVDRVALVRELTPQLAQQGSPALIRFDRLALVQPGPGGWRHGWPWRIDATFPLVG
jgi:hypothetical protein